MEWHAIKGVLVGLAAHQANPIIEGWEARPSMPPAWGRLCRYIVGGLVFIPVCRMFFRYLYRQGMTEDEAVDMFTAASVLSFVSIMVGVVIGYLVDGVLEKLR